jgi:integrase
MRGMPKGRRYANDRAPTLEEIQRLTEYPDRRIKLIILVTISSGIRVGAWDTLRWKHITPIYDDDNNILAAKLIVYPGENEKYFTFMTPEAY